MLLMLTGASTGSTSGAIKNIRLYLLVKCALREIKKLFHPSGIFAVRINGKRIEENDLQRTLLFVGAYLSLFLVLGLLLLLFTPMDVRESLASCAACLGGVGAGKWILILAMILGRLEIFPLLAVLNPRFWNAVKVRFRQPIG
ncbi:MAG: hypothetical protein A2293_13585 [Elusimicrobia bacterium RIFOXYB2_FULL_49_7]|nr:MAG: hypothetical protein A2293_13585 [Elusimicrobia bacterium RIFOXYB2_FULL_49_7]